MALDKHWVGCTMVLAVADTTVAPDIRHSNTWFEGLESSLGEQVLLRLLQCGYEMAGSARLPIVVESL